MSVGCSGRLRDKRYEPLKAAEGSGSQDRPGLLVRAIGPGQREWVLAPGCDPHGSCQEGRLPSLFGGVQELTLLKIIR